MSPTPTIVKASAQASKEKEAAAAALLDQTPRGKDADLLKSSPASQVADYFISLFIVAPLTVGFWRGAWQLFEESPRPIPDVVIAAGGATVHLVFSIVRDLLCETWQFSRRSKKRKCYYEFMSRLYTYVFGLACISHWRGVWFLLDAHVAKATHAAAIGLWVGAIACLVGVRCVRNLMAPPLIIVLDGPDLSFTFSSMFRSNVQRKLSHFLHPDRHRLVYYVSSRTYTALYGFCCVNSWRGVWSALDYYTGVNPPTVVALTTVSIVALAIMKTLRNVSAPPFVLVTDNHDNYFQVPTMFQTSSKQTTLYILDCLFSVLIVHTLVVFVWRGAWCIFDIYLTPHDYNLSAWLSVCLGYTIALMAFALQPCMMRIVLWVDGWWRVVLVDAYHLFSFFGTVNIWRGVWNVLNCYLMPENALASNWISHVLSFALLVLLNCANSILVRGVYIDAEEAGSQCVEFPVYYLRLFFQNRRRKKLLRSRGTVSCIHSNVGRRRSEKNAGDAFLHDTNHFNKRSRSPSPTASRKSSSAQPQVQSCLNNHHNHHHGQHIRVQLPTEKEMTTTHMSFIDIPESPV